MKGIFYCLKCHKIATKRHKCSPLTYVSITRNMLNTVVTMDYLGFKVYSAVSYPEMIKKGLYKLDVEIEFRHKYAELILQEMPNGWSWYTFDAQFNTVKKSGLVYSEDFIGTKAKVNERFDTIIAEFMAYLSTKDAEGFKAILAIIS